MLLMPYCLLRGPSTQRIIETGCPSQLPLPVFPHLLTQASQQSPPHSLLSQAFLFLLFHSFTICPGAVLRQVRCSAPRNRGMSGPLCPYEAYSLPGDSDVVGEVQGEGWSTAGVLS